MLIALTFVRLCLAAWLPLTPDEAYYWTWSRHLQGGYLDHPPMVAFWIRLGTATLGENALGVRLTAPLSAFAGSMLLWHAAEDLFPGKNSGPRAVCLLNATVVLGLGAATATPDTPLVFFIVLALFALGRLMATGRGGWWLVAGAAFGLAFDSKYTALLPAAACGVWWCITRSQYRHWRWVLLALAAGLLTILPVISWNAGHDWASFVKQGGRAADWKPQRAIQFLGELIGGQVGLATPLVFLLFVLGAHRMFLGARRERVPCMLALMIGVPLAVFVQHAFGGRVQANWPVLLYPALAIAAADVPFRVRGAVISGLLITGAVYVQALFAPVPLSAHHDVIARQTAGWGTMARDIKRLTRSDEVIVAADYAVAAELAFYGRGMPVYGYDRRWAYLGLKRAVATHGVLIVKVGETPDLSQGWQLDGGRGSVCRRRHADPLVCYTLFRIQPSVMYRLPVPS